jgi:threonine dehydratase
MTSEVTYEGVLAAAEAIAPHLPPTPAWSYPLLDQAAGVTVVVKHENVQPTGAFKVRGGINLALSLTPTSGRPGWSPPRPATTRSRSATAPGWSARPRSSSSRVGAPSKVAAVRALGGEVVVHGPTMDEAVEEAKRLAGERGLRYVDPGNEPAIVHGHATVYLELLQRHPELEAIYVPVGSGTGASGACVVRRFSPRAAASSPCSRRRTGRPPPGRTGARLRLRAGPGRAAWPREPATRCRSGSWPAGSTTSSRRRRRPRRGGGLLASHAHTLAESAGAAAWPACSPTRTARSAAPSS